MREIKFKFWLSHTCKMTYAHDLFAIADIIPKQNGHTIPLQFTGFKDKLGVEIYEGDILSNGAASQNISVKYERGAFWCYADELLGYETEVKYDIDTDPYICFHDCDPSKWATVIGNVFENPELLKK